MDVDNKQTFFQKFINGDFGLAITYWVFLILANILFKIFLAAIGESIDSYTVMVFSGFWLVYQPIALIATSRAIKKYQGKKIWRALAIIAVVLAWAGYIMSILEVIVAISDFANRKQTLKSLEVTAKNNSKNEIKLHKERKNSNDLSKEFKKYGYFKKINSVPKNILYNKIIPQKKINPLFLDKEIEEVVQYRDNLFITYERGSNTYLYQYLQKNDIWDLKKSFLIEDNVCLKPSIYKNYLATYCYDKKNLYLLDLKNYTSKTLHAKDDITDILWDGNRLVCASGGFKIEWLDSNLSLVGKVDYDYSLAPYYVRKNVKKSDFNLANVHLRKNNGKILAYSRYLTMLIDSKSKKILHTSSNVIPMGMVFKKYYYLKNWDNFFKDKHNWGIFVLPDDAWLESADGNFYINVLSLGKVIIWQWPLKSDKNIAVINYDLNGTKDINITSNKYFPKKYTGSLKDKVGKVGFFYTAKGFEAIHYGKNLQDIKLLSYGKKPDLQIKSFYYDKSKNEINLLTVQFKTDLDKFYITPKGKNFYFAYEPDINLPRDYLDEFLKDERYSFMLRRKYHISKWQGKKRIKEKLTLVKYPWGMIKCGDNIAIYGSGTWCGLDIYDKNLNLIAHKYKKETVKALSCFEGKKILSLSDKIVLYDSWHNKPRVLAKLPGILDESFTVGFIKGVPFYAGRKDNSLALHILDRKEKVLRLDFFPTKALVKDDYIALIDKNTLLVQYKDKIKKIAKIDGYGIDWWGNDLVYSKNGVIYKYNIATKSAVKLIDFDIRRYQGIVQNVYIKNDRLVYVMSDMYVVFINLKSKKVTIKNYVS